MAEIIKWRTVGGVQAGLDEHHVVAINTETEDIKTLEIRGRWYYCKQCELPENIGGIMLPEACRVNTQFCLVLGIGTGCGKFYKLSKTEKKMADMRSSVVLGVKPYDRILAPESHGWGITRSPYRPDEDFFIHECIISAVIPSEE